MWVDAEEIERKGAEPLLKMADGILVPGGFGNRGIEGKIEAIRFARESRRPFLGICLGMQCAAIEFGRNVAGLKNANSSEFDSKTPHPVIDLIPSQKDLDEKGGTMRLGAYPCELKKGSLAYRAYRTDLVAERHRHRYEFNNKYLETFRKAGMTVSGLYPKEQLVEIIELTDHPWFLATQFHPEFRSRPTAPHPVFRDFIKAALEASKTK
jgi:CTP synthase